MFQWYKLGRNRKLKGAKGGVADASEQNVPIIKIYNIKERRGKANRVSVGQPYF